MPPFIKSIHLGFHAYVMGNDWAMRVIKSGMDIDQFMLPIQSKGFWYKKDAMQTIFPKERMPIDGCDIKIGHSMHEVNCLVHEKAADHLSKVHCFRVIKFAPIGGRG